MIDAYISNLESQENALSHFRISQESLSKIFYNINKINFLQSIILNKGTNINDNNINDNENDILTVVSIPSGTSIGGSAWTCNYRLFNFVYASQFSIEPKIIADPFPYKKLKKINYFITDNKYQKEVPIVRKVVDEDFDKKIRECFENKKNIFIPTDNINSMLEMITKFEKLLDEYKESYSNKIDRPEYKILVCSNCSNEIVEGIKSLTEFLGKKISQQFCSFGEKPFNFEDAICIKNMDEFKTEFNKKNIKYIILATFETLNIGLGYSILPFILGDKNFVMVNIFREYDLKSVFGNIIKEVKRLNNNIISYKEKKVVERKIPEKKEKLEEEKNKKEEEIKNKDNKNNKNNLSDNKIKNNIINNSSYKMIVEKKNYLFCLIII
jgi:Cft2 family RNA processing exonuclease